MVLIEMAHEVGLQPKWAAGTEGGEYKSSCPNCGGVDRFSLQPNKQMQNCLGRYYCRKCYLRGDSIKFACDFLGLSFQQAVIRTNATIDKHRNILSSFYQEKRVVSPVSIIKPSGLWQDKATKFTRWAHDNISNNSEILAWLHKRGLPKEAVQKYQIGWCPDTIWRERPDWGLEPLEKKKLWIPKGIVIPTLDKKGQVIRLKIRRDEYCEGDSLGKYIVISGSMNGLNIIGSNRREVMLVTESELDAYVCDYVAGDLICSVAVGNNTKRPDAATNYYATQMKCLLVSPDNDEGGNVMAEKWKGLYPHTTIYSTPFGKDIGEAIEQGLKLRPWILQYKWKGHKDQNLIDYILNYIDSRHGPTRPSYTPFEQEIFLGPDSPRAKSGELQDGLQLMRDLIEGNYKN